MLNSMESSKWKEESEDDVKNSNELIVDNKTGLFVDDTLAEYYSLRDLYVECCRALHLKTPNAVIANQLPCGVGFLECMMVLELRCESTYLGNRGVLALASILPFCPALSLISLRGVGLTSRDFAISALLSACESCPCLQTLDLSDNDLGVLVNNKNVEVNDIYDYKYYNIVNTDIICVLLKLVQVNSSLQELCLHRCGLSENAIERIQLAMKLRAHNNVHENMFNTLHTNSSHSLTSVEDDTDMATLACTTINNIGTSTNKNSSFKNSSFFNSVLKRQNEWNNINERKGIERKQLSREVAVGLSEIQRRLYYNRHCMEEVYKCFCTTDNDDNSIISITNTSGTPGLKCNEGNIVYEENCFELDNKVDDLNCEEIRQACKLQHNDSTEEKVMSEEQGTINKESEKSLCQNKLVCSWSNFYQGLLSLRVYFFSESVERAVTFASACGLLTSDSVRVDKLLFLLRPHATIIVDRREKPSKNNCNDVDCKLFNRKETFNKMFNSSYCTTKSDVQSDNNECTYLRSKTIPLQKRSQKSSDLALKHANSASSSVHYCTTVTSDCKNCTPEITNNVRREQKEELETLSESLQLSTSSSTETFMHYVVVRLVNYCNHNYLHRCLHGWCHPAYVETLQEWLIEFSRTSLTNSTKCSESDKENVVPVHWPDIPFFNSNSTSHWLITLHFPLQQTTRTSCDDSCDKNTENQLLSMNYWRLQFVIDRLYDCRNKLMTMINSQLTNRTELESAQKSNVHDCHNNAKYVELSTFVCMCSDCIGKEYNNELRYIVQKYWEHVQTCQCGECADLPYKAERVDGKVLRRNEDINSVYTNKDDRNNTYFCHERYIDCTAFLFSHLKLTSSRIPVPKQELYKAWRRCTSDYLQNVLSSIDLK